MSRCGPPGRTATDRDASRTQVGPSEVHLCPEEVEVLAQVRESGQYISPSRLHAMYTRFIESAQTDYDFGGVVLTYLTRRGSVPVDIHVGERVARRLVASRG